MSRKIIFDKKNILVVGGAGFIGSHLCDRLIVDAKVICVDNFVSGDEKNIDHLLSNPNFAFIKHDITEPLDLEEFPELRKFKIEFQGIQEVYNLACPTSPFDFANNKINNLLANSYGMKNVLDMALKHEAKFLHFSSSVVYGPIRGEKKHFTEKDLGVVDCLSGRSSYDEGKRFAETMVQNYREVYQMDAKIIRLFRTYGPRMKLDQGHLIPDFINSALEGEDLEIVGDENFSSSFCYISDCIDAATKMMDSNLIGPMNMGSDTEINLTDLARQVIQKIGSSSGIKYVNEHFFVTPLCLPDISKAREEMGWLPVIIVSQGLQTTIDDLRASKGLKNVKQVLNKEDE